GRQSPGRSFPIGSRTTRPLRDEVYSGTACRMLLRSASARRHRTARRSDSREMLPAPEASAGTLVRHDPAFRYSYVFVVVRGRAVAGVLGEANSFYFGAVAGGVWKTTDGGATWRPLTDGTPISSVGALAVAPSNPDIIYVGTGEAAPRGDMTYGDGVYKSVDGGRTWSHAGLRDTRQIGALIVDPKNPDIVLVAALGHAFGPNSERGVFRTADGGKSWSKVLY